MEAWGADCGAGASVSLQNVAEAFQAYLSMSLNECQLLGYMYASAPGRRHFLRQAAAAKSRQLCAKSVASQLSSFAAVLHKTLGYTEEKSPHGPQNSCPQDGTQPLRSHEEVAHAWVCAVEFWLQHVQQLLAFDAAAATALNAADEGPPDITVVCREMEQLSSSLAAVAADSKLPLHTRKASGEVLLLMAVVALSVSHGTFPGGALEPTKAQNQGNSTKRRQILRRVLRKALQGILSAPGDGTDGASTAMREEAVAAAHAVLHWRGVSRGSLRASVGPLALSLMEVAQKGALMKSDVTAAMGRSLLCRLTWLWRPSSRHAAQGDPVQQKRGQQTPFGVPCLFSEALNSAQQSVVGLLGAHNSGDHREEASSGPERFLLLRSLQIIRDLLLYGAGQTFPSQGAVSAALLQVEEEGGRFFIVNVNSLGATLLAATARCCEAFVSGVTAAAAAVGDFSAPQQQEQEQQQEQQQDSALPPTPKEQPQHQPFLLRRGGKGSQKKWRKQLQQMEQHQQQRQQQHNDRNCQSASVLQSSSSAEREGAPRSTSSDSGGISKKGVPNGTSRKPEKCGKRSSKAEAAGATASLVLNQLDDLPETELFATNAATLEAALNAAGALVEVAGPGGVLSCLSVFTGLLQTVLNLPSPLHHSMFAARFGSCLLSFIRCLLRGIPAASPAVHRLCSLHAVAVCRNLLSRTHWRHACHVARHLAIAEDGESLALLHEQGLMTKPHRNKQTNGKSCSGSLGSTAADEALWGLHATESEGLLLLAHAWRSTCGLIEELLYAGSLSVLGLSTVQLEAFADALVLGVLTTGLSCGPGKGEPHHFARFVVSDPCSLISALHLLTASIRDVLRCVFVAADVCFPPPSTLRAASSLLRRLQAICCSGPFGAAQPLGFMQFQVDNESTSRSMDALQQQSTAALGTVSPGAVETALTNLDFAIRNAACGRGAEGAAALGQASVEGGEGVASRFLLRPEQLRTHHDTLTGSSRANAAVYAACELNFLSLASQTSYQEGACPHHKPKPSDNSQPQEGSCSSKPARLQTVKAPALSPLLEGSSRGTDSENRQSLEARSATPSKAEAHAFLSTTGAEPRYHAGQTTNSTRNVGSPAQTQLCTASGSEVGDGTYPDTVASTAAAATAAAAAEGALEKIRQHAKRQRCEFASASSQSGTPSSGWENAEKGHKSDDEVVILEGAASPSVSRRSKKAVPSAGAVLAEGGAVGASGHLLFSPQQCPPAPRQQQQSRTQQQQLHQTKEMAVEERSVELAAEAQARGRIRQLLHCRSLGSP